MSKGGGKPKQLTMKPSNVNNNFNKVNKNGAKGFGPKALPKPKPIIKD